MPYDPTAVIQAYTQKAEIEDESEKAPSLRVELPREFIKKYLKPSDVVLDAGGGTGINALFMAERCKRVTLLDITPRILQLAEGNIRNSLLVEKIELVQGDITDLSRFQDGEFSFVVCVGDALSYALDKRFQAVKELVRVAQKSAILLIGCDSKFGFMRLHLAQGLLEEALEIERTSECECGMGPWTHLYTVEEMSELLIREGCEVLEVASTPTLTDTIAPVVREAYYQEGEWESLKELERSLCTRPELLGVGLHLLFVARKN